MSYNGCEKEVEICGKKYTAFFPNRHTTVKGIVIFIIDGTITLEIIGLL
jgi:hypothetical protein